MPIEAKKFEHQDETVTFDHGRVHLVSVGSITISYEVLQRSPLTSRVQRSASPLSA